MGSPPIKTYLATHLQYYPPRKRERSERLLGPLTHLQKRSSIGDRRFLLSRKRNTNLGDLVTRWRRSLVHASFNWSNDPVSIMFAQAAQALEEQDNFVNPGIAPVDPVALPNLFPKLLAGRDALAFPSLSQITLDQAWARSSTQRTFSTEQSN